MKLYAFYYKGYGDMSYFVLADNEDEAKDSVIKLMQKNKEGTAEYLTEFLNRSYDIEMYRKGHPACHSND